MHNIQSNIDLVSFEVAIVKPLNVKPKSNQTGRADPCENTLVQENEVSRKHIREMYDSVLHSSQ